VTSIPESIHDCVASVCDILECHNVEGHYDKLLAGLSLWTSSGKITSKDVRPDASARSRPLGRVADGMPSTGSSDASGRPADANA
jgi:hypothetical protein